MDKNNVIVLFKACTCCGVHINVRDHMEELVNWERSNSYAAGMSEDMCMTCNLGIEPEDMCTDDLPF